MTMNSEAVQNLPPELQARIANIIANGGNGAVAGATQQAQPAPQAQPQAAIQKPPSLMDHLIALRQEVAALRQENANLAQQVAANSNVVEACGQAVGTIYQMFQQTPDQGSTYSSQFQQQQVDDTADY